MEKKCLQCGFEVEGRIDKKFCCDDCRYSYNNVIKNNPSIKNINAVLRKNRSVIEKFGEGAKVNELILLQNGFNFKYFTHTYSTLKGETYYYCYEYGYKSIGKDLYFFVKQKH